VRGRRSKPSQSASRRLDVQVSTFRRLRVVAPKRVPARAQNTLSRQASTSVRHDVAPAYRAPSPKSSSASQGIPPRARRFRDKPSGRRGGARHLNARPRRAKQPKPREPRADLQLRARRPGRERAAAQHERGKASAWVCAADRRLMEQGRPHLDGIASSLARSK
jgi:hypothetical protein